MKYEENACYMSLTSNRNLETINHYKRGGMANKHGNYSQIVPKKELRPFTSKVISPIKSSQRSQRSGKWRPKQILRNRKLSILFSYFYVVCVQYSSDYPLNQSYKCPQFKNCTLLQRQVPGMIYNDSQVTTTYITETWQITGLISVPQCLCGVMQ